MEFLQFPCLKVGIGKAADKECFQSAENASRFIGGKCWYMQVGSKGHVSHYLGVTHGVFADSRQSLLLEGVISVPITGCFACSLPG